MPEIPTRILLVEHEPALREVMRLVFADEPGYELVEVQSIVQAVAYLARETCQLILTDGFSATPDGVAASTLPLRRAAGAIPVVLLTAHLVQPETALAEGFAAVIHKPFDLDVLLSRVRALLD